ncbi:amidohydrolase family protein [Desulforhabdus amnigena]|uniref:Metal-dependent hydrolase n=1 Tax=Desulforhabdus amnigena TaxID=40218 RepID=A0A9W6L9Y0_9BACT|nr:amidohydrolase family protein [Desulforhabdus amnigena]NLJ26487.1 amidohydrolase family protein [Deltaproteobacteria bacterium]GLI35864.1 metal-dependent hydrolase [Desulforhabdus amnigena]
MNGSNVVRKPSAKRFEFHRAAWVLPVSSPPISNGAVLTDGEKIVAVGNFKTLGERSPRGATQVDHGNAAIIPALVNAHTHLELSAMQGAIPLPQSSFGTWVQELFSRKSTLSPEPAAASIGKGRRQLFESGTGLYGDIANTPELKHEEDSQTPEGVTFLELLGFDRKEMETPDPDLLRKFLDEAETDASLSIAAHACYSTSAGVIQKAKEWARVRQRPFSMHVAEHQEEMEFLQTGNGFCRQLLENLGRWVPEWEPPQTSPVQYLKRLGVLDAGTLLVHAVHMTPSDWKILAENHCPVCFCPRSNRHLNTGRADIGSALKYGLVSALGTDSLASNKDLNLFAEAAFVLDHYPEVPPTDLLTMMTLGGAKALRHDNTFGSLEPGKRLAFLAVFLPESTRLPQLFETIIDQGKKGAWQWAHCLRNS